MKFLVFGGGGKVARHFARLAVNDGHSVTSVVRNDTHDADLKALGATPTMASLEDASVQSLTDLLKSNAPDAVVFAAGAGGKGDPSRTVKVDYEGAVKVFDAMEGADIKRLLYVGAVDIRDRSKGFPEYYDEESRERSEKTYKAIGRYVDAKYKAELELHKRSLEYTVVRPGGLTDDPAKGAEVGITQLKQTSRELVAKALLAFANEPKSAGLTLDVIDGEGDLEAEVKKAVEARTDAWTG